MIKDFEKLKRNYAKLAVHRGLNLPKGASVRIFADLDQPDFVKMLTEECYQAGANYVYVNWLYRPIDRMVKEKTPIEVLRKFNPLVKAEIDFDMKNDVHYIYLSSLSSDYLKGLSEERVTVEYANRRRYMLSKNNANRARSPFTYLTVPGEEWAKLVLPNLPIKQAMEKLWKAIFAISHVNADDPYKEWDQHCVKCERYAKKLEKLNIKSLHFTSKNGTDLVVGLLDKYRIQSVIHYSLRSKRSYNPNFPCEECYTSPHRLKVDGVLYGTKPICNAGKIIDGIKLTFKHGRIIEAKAKRNEKLLRNLINESESTHYLGEVSLIPFSSPANKTGIPIFYDCTIDENMGCHLAIGNGFYYACKDGERLSKNELVKCGINSAPNHIDFVIGTPDLNVVATTKNNKLVEIFKNGEWAKNL